MARQSLVGNERGSMIVMVAVSLAVMLGMGALAVDMGMLIKQRDDAQRAADAAALAGASAFQEGKPQDMIAEAGTRALNYLAKNYVGGTFVDTAVTSTYINGGNRYITEANEGVVVVLPDSEKVRVIVRRDAVGVLLAKALNFLDVPISAHAAAEAIEMGAGKCVKPFAFPDYWHDADDDTDPANRLEDLGPGQGQGGEAWEYDPGAGDHYRRFGDTEGAGDITGLGSSWRNNYTYDSDRQDRRYFDDMGRPIILKKSNPQQTSAPGFFLPWVIPGSNPGAADYKANIVGCNPAEISLETDYNLDGTADTSSYDNKPGNMIGPTKQGMDSLISLDPDACWAEFPSTVHTGYTTGEVKKLSPAGNCTEEYSGWMSSPRVAVVPLFDPGYFSTGRTALRFNNLALIFLEPQLDRHAPVAGRFIYFVRGTGNPGPEAGSLIKAIKLVE